MTLKGKDVVMLSTGLGVGGGAKLVTELLVGLQSRKWLVGLIIIVASGDSRRVDPSKVALLEDRGIPVHILGGTKGLSIPAKAVELVRVLRRWKPGILHTHMVHANLLGRLMRPITGVPVVISTAHSINEGPRWREWGYRLTDRFSDLTTQVSLAGADRYVSIRAVPQSKMQVVPNGVDVQQFRPDVAAREKTRRLLEVEGRFVWLAVGRFEPAKNHTGLVHAFARIARGGDAILLLAGQGPLLGEVQRQVNELGLSKQVRFLGVRRDMPELMNAADGYVMSSSWEGMPVVLLEASACGLPLVVTDVGGNREVVVDGETGYVVQSKDSEQLAEAMERLMESEPEELAQFGRAARARVVDEFNLEAMVENWERIYTGLLRRKKLLGFG